MKIFTDSPEFAARILPETPPGSWAPVEADADTARLPLAFLGQPLWSLQRPTRSFDAVLITESAERSNYDRLIELVREGHPLPDRLACLAGAGRGFHGFKDRAWSAVTGNLHLSVHLAPRRPIERFEVAFMALAAVAVIDALDQAPGLEGRARIRWVNDIVVDDAKVGGVLAYTHTQQTTVNAAVLGVGVNVETSPAVEPTPFVPAVTTVAEHAEPQPALLATVLQDVMDALDDNYRLLLESGHHALAERYRARSMVVGREVAVCDERSDAEPRVLRRGTVRGIGDGLELFLDGVSEPVTRGRILLPGDPGSPAS